MFIHTHSLTMFMAILFACSFLSASGPVGCPQNPSLLRCECFYNALAPTESLDTLLSLCNSSMLRTWFRLLKLCSSCWMHGHGISYVPTVFLNPTIVIMPRPPICNRNFFTDCSTTLKLSTSSY